MKDGVIVYHGGTQIVESPLCKFGRRNLDFGQGFYVTDIRQQAVDWAIKKGSITQERPLLNRYLLKRESFIAEGRSLIFKAYDAEWFDFIVASRMEQNPSAGYDYIEGGVANDRVIDSINLYLQGFLTRDIALQRLAEHQPNNQLCLLNQCLTDKYLIFDGTEEL